jgi:hypothetical protein
MSTESKLPQTRSPEPCHSTTTRQEALTESLRAGTTPEPPREFSTLVERSEPVYRTPGFDDGEACIERGFNIRPVATRDEHGMLPHEAAAHNEWERGYAAGEAAAAAGDGGGRLGPECSPDCPVVADPHANHVPRCPAYTGQNWRTGEPDV